MRKKIAGAGDLESVVRSMKALAASSIGQYEKAVEALDGYHRTVELGLAACLRRARPLPLAAERSMKDGKTIGAIVFGSDQGLVGRFNEVLLEFTIRTLDALAGKTAKIWAVGERIQALIADSGLPAARLLSVPDSVTAITRVVGELLIEIEAARARSEIIEVWLFHNHPESSAVYAPVTTRLLPLDRAWRDKCAALPWPSKRPPEVIERESAALQAFIRGYLFVLLFRACAESLASENASRLASMRRAEKNIEKILVELNRRFHRVRQEAIDEELFDVISGFEALSGTASRTSLT